MTPDISRSKRWIAPNDFAARVLEFLQETPTVDRKYPDNEAREVMAHFKVYDVMFQYFCVIFFFLFRLERV